MMVPPSRELLLIPYPQKVEGRPGSATLSGATTLRLGTGLEAADRRTARHLQAAAKTLTALDLALRASSAPAGHGRPDLLLVSESLAFSASPEAYRLEIAPERIVVAAPEAAGRFYGVQTLIQLLRQFGRQLPCLLLEDAPVLPQRGVMLDLSRGKVPTLATLKELVERLAALKINQLQLYIEHTFDFERHPLLGAGHSPLTPADILALDEHCRRWRVALVPNLQSFGHVHHTLEHERYRHLAESDFRDGWTLSPVVPETYGLLRELYEEFLPCFSQGPYFNVDCDETWDLGQGKSKARAEADGGIGPLYLEHLLKVRELIGPYGRRMLCWGDILERHPELIARLPKDVILLNWGYDAHGQETQYLAKSRTASQAGLEHWVCPGTGGWLSFFFRKDNARDCMLEWSRVARATGATGYLNTDWGDEGHLNCLGASYWSFAYGADRAWRGEPDADSAERFDERFRVQMLPGAPPEWLGALNLLGNQYQVFAPSQGLPNNILWGLLRGEFGRDETGAARVRYPYYKWDWPMPAPDELLAALERSEQAGQILDRAWALSVELEWVRREWLAGARLGECACRRALALLGHPRAESPAVRGGLLREAMALRHQAWMVRNQMSDWPQLREKLEALCGSRE